MGDSSRAYRKKNTDYVSVTTVLDCAMKWGLVYFYGKYGITEAKRISNEATAVGRYVDAYVKNDLFPVAGVTHKAITLTDEMKQSVANYHVWKEEFKPKAVNAGHVVYHDTERYAGDYDMLIEFDKYYALVDYKTSKAVYADYRLQVEAYYRAGTWDHLTKPLKLGVVRFGKEGKFDAQSDFKVFDPSESAWAAFKGLLSYYKWSKETTE